MSFILPVAIQDLDKVWMQTSPTSYAMAMSQTCCTVPTLVLLVLVPAVGPTQLDCSATDKLYQVCYTTVLSSQSLHPYNFARDNRMSLIPGLENGQEMWNGPCSGL